MKVRWCLVECHFQALSGAHFENSYRMVTRRGDRSCSESHAVHFGSESDSQRSKSGGVTGTLTTVRLQKMRKDRKKEKKKKKKGAGELKI